MNWDKYWLAGFRGEDTPRHTEQRTTIAIKVQTHARMGFCVVAPHLRTAISSAQAVYLRSPLEHSLRVLCNRLRQLFHFHTVREAKLSNLLSREILFSDHLSLAFLQ